MARAVLITNPAAARTRPDTVDVVVDTLRRGGWSLDVRATGGPGDARQFASEAVADGVDCVAVLGGDGTTMQAASAMVGTDVALGLIPGGTGNLLAGNLRVPGAAARAAATILGGRTRCIDLGRMECQDEVHFFAVACGAGFDARVMIETPSDLKHRWGMGAYVATIFRLLDQLKSATHQITVDGKEYEAHAALVIVANCAEVVPPFIKFRHGISPEDGVLDIIVVRADSLSQSVLAVWDLLRYGTDDPTSAGYVGYARGTSIQVRSTPEQPVQLDGDAGGRTPFSVQVVPRAIRVFTP
jgi:YegS/Rv2252/BmrU family lipid kinase